MHKHILQTEAWAKFKSSYGTPSIHAGNVYYTKHAIPLTDYFYAYCPRINPSEVDFAELKKSLEKNHCIACNFDVPNIVSGTPEAQEATELLEKHCVKSRRDVFAKANYLVDLTKSEEELLGGMHHKQRYNIRLAEKKGVTVKKPGKDDMDIFFALYSDTAKRQGYYYRSKNYFDNLWEIFEPLGICHLLIVEYEGKPLASWMLFVYDDVLYYPYGGSTLENKDLQANALIGWEAIKFGKKNHCQVFDMWGAAIDPTDTKDPYYGFTNFKSKFGGEHVVYIDSYDFVVNPTIYNIFNFLNTLRWKFLDLIR